MKRIWLKILALLCLISLLALAWLHFQGKIVESNFKLAFLFISVGYFVVATLSLSSRFFDSPDNS